ncbi:hypothetical protein [Streptomyces sp. NPDC093568]|uniref:hypothetical protein n=1 Tax=Streptomyces sp. NPDC093568 TaxID=3366041 RepID=UPI0037FCC304
MTEQTEHAPFFHLEADAVECLGGTELSAQLHRFDHYVTHRCRSSQIAAEKPFMEAEISCNPDCPHHKESYNKLPGT